MDATLLLRERLVLSEAEFVEVVVWSVPKSVPGSRHGFKYSLALIANGDCLLRYDNEAGKGDHKHIGDRQVSYHFHGLEALQNDFWRDVIDMRTRS